MPLKPLPGLSVRRTSDGSELTAGDETKWADCAVCGRGVKSRCSFALSAVCGLR
eukprot:CAMPEP_0119383028 /NCGR_PEP_ID=MMETSP1334-20130426/76412_1 /TAXON_ID=127549 /ORGANISM="Calcidiscus leptoporus, Strain RCC1130" /LENGTH=53 /DNA_ID=CAMNT_0007403703 /DNA_START=70 /DNA_END=228 /DNA_ORIENTATION=+